MLEFNYIFKSNYKSISYDSIFLQPFILYGSFIHLISNQTYVYDIIGPDWEHIDRVEKFRDEFMVIQCDLTKNVSKPVLATLGLNESCLD